MEITTMTPRDFILPSLYADALALGPHWIYDRGEIRRHYPAGLKSYDLPRSSYHPGKRAGDFTHYGDQTRLLLESVAKEGTAWTEEKWRDTWAAWWRGNPCSYRDGATSHTLENLDAGRIEPSESSDLGGASRIAPLFLLAGKVSDEQLVTLARAQTIVTHGDPQVADAAEFLVRAALAIASGESFEEAFDGAAFHPYEALQTAEAVTSGRRAASAGDFEKEAESLGIACNISGAFPLMLALAFRYENSPPEEALEANALLGGDSAARGLALGVLLGAKHGAAAFPAAWSAGLAQHEAVEKALTDGGA